jgi:pyridoxal/pyridoxine/pyridoxamine kinase
MNSINKHVIICEKGYPSWTGNRLSANDVQELFDGLEVNGLTDEYTHVLTGMCTCVYIGAQVIHCHVFYRLYR